MSTLIVALLLLPIAVVLLGGLLALLARPLVTPAIAALEGVRFRRCRMRVARGDLQLQGRQVDTALREFEAAFCFMTVRADARLAEQIGRHHVGLLSRL